MCTTYCDVCVCAHQINTTKQKNHKPYFCLNGWSIAVARGINHKQIVSILFFMNTAERCILIVSENSVAMSIFIYPNNDFTHAIARPQMFM